MDSGDTTAEQGVEFGSGERALQEAAAHTAAVKDMADQIKRRREEQISRGKQSRELRATVRSSVANGNAGDVFLCGWCLVVLIVGDRCACSSRECRSMSPRSSIASINWRYVLVL